MTYSLTFYSVSLVHFQEIIGSKKEPLIKLASEWLEENKLPSGDTAGHQDSARHFWQIHLNDLVLSDFVPGKLPLIYPQNSQSEPYFLSDVLLALFAIDELFDQCGWVRLTNLQNIYQELSNSYILNEELELLWSFLFKGRSLVENNTGGTKYYSYLTNQELVTFLKSFELFETANAMHKATFENLQRNLGGLAAKSRDLFVISD